MSVYKKSSIIVDGKKYIYSVRERKDDIKITVYELNIKKPYFTAYFSYVESWGFSVHRPKTIEVLIKFYNQNQQELSKNEFLIMEQQELFQMLLDCYFSDDSNEKRDRFIENCIRLR